MREAAFADGFSLLRNEEMSCIDVCFVVERSSP